MVRVQLRWNVERSSRAAVTEALAMPPVGFSAKKAGRRAAKVLRKSLAGRWYTLGRFLPERAETLRERLEPVLEVRLRR